MTNQELMQQFESYADRVGIFKAEGGTLTLDTANFGGIMPKQAVEELVNLTRKQNEWLSQLNSVTRLGSSGTVPVLEINEPISEGVIENDDTVVSTTPPTRNVPYVFKKIKSEWHVTVDDLREAAAAGIENFESKMQESFGIALGNDLANLVYNGDKTLGNNTRLNRLLRTIDGIGVKSETANILDASGKAFGKGIFAAMLDHMPDRFSNDPNLHWFFNRRVNTHYVDELGERATLLGDKALTEAVTIRPEGIPSLIIPHISSGKGSTPIAPTSAADGTTYIEFVLTTLVTAGDPSTAALGVGRKFKVTLKSTGISEICTGFLDTTLRIRTTGLLGQATVSTTNTDYEVSVADETEILLGNPKGITLVQGLQMSSYRTFVPKNDRFEIITYHYADVLFTAPEAFVKFKRVSIPQKTSW